MTQLKERVEGEANLGALSMRVMAGGRSGRSGIDGWAVLMGGQCPPHFYFCRLCQNSFIELAGYADDYL